MKQRFQITFYIVFLLFVAIGLLVTLGGAGMQMWDYFLGDTTEITVTVTSVDRAEDRWMVLGEDEDGNPVSLVNKDNWFRRKFNSSDIQAGLRVGETYRFVVYGKRIPTISSYPNILEVLPLESSA